MKKRIISNVNLLAIGGGGCNYSVLKSKQNTVTPNVQMNRNKRRCESC